MSEHAVGVYDQIKARISGPCCDIWPKIADKFGWMRYTDYPEIRSMPFLQGEDGIRWRVQFCPSCGKERRDVTEETEV